MNEQHAEQAPPEEKVVRIKNNWAWDEPERGRGFMVVEFTELEDGGGHLTYRRKTLKVLPIGEVPDILRAEKEEWPILHMPHAQVENTHPYIWVDEREGIAYRMNRDYSRIIGP